MSGKSPKPVINIDDVPTMDITNGGKFQSTFGRIGPLIGSTGIGCAVSTVPPGKRAFPFHTHHNSDELFYILNGSGEYRFGDETYPVSPGDVVAGPKGGPEHAHQLINTGDDELRYLAISTTVDTDVVEYPDSGKFAANSRFDWGNPAAGGVHFIGRKESSLSYFDGEDD